MLLSAVHWFVMLLNCVQWTDFKKQAWFLVFTQEKFAQLLQDVEYFLQSFTGYNITSSLPVLRSSQWCGWGALLLGYDAASLGDRGSTTLKMKALLSVDTLGTDYIVTLLCNPEERSLRPPCWAEGRLCRSALSYWRVFPYSETEPTTTHPFFF